MVNIPDEIEAKISKYLKLLKENNIPIKKAFLFGSYAKGNFNKWSDIDIALISEIFKGDRISDKDKIRNLTLSVSSEIEVIPFSPKDFNSEDPFALEILRTGIELI
jgi:uncharacterized protein